MKKLLLSIFALMITFCVKAQVIDNFTDLDYTSNPTWTGTLGDWTVVASSDVAAGATNSNTLRLAGQAVTGTSYLSTQRIISWGTSQSWGVWLGRRLNAATAANASYIWLYASEANVTSATVDGYRIRFGDDTGGDDIFLEKITDGVATTVIQSSGSTTNGITDYGFQIRVTRSAAGLWNLYTSTLPTVSGTGAVASDQLNATTTSVAQGSATDNTYTDFSNGFFSIAALHSTSANATTALEVDNLKFQTSDTATLPVSLTSFTGKNDGQSISLNWQTSSEQNNDHFDIMRSADGKTFSKIGKVDGFGTTQDVHNYSFKDEQPAPGTNYYQLSQVDHDGTSTLSNILAIKSNVTASSFKVVSNTDKNTVDLAVYAATDGNSSFKIYDLSGRKLVDKVLPLVKGYNTFTFPVQVAAQGVHIATLITGTETITNKYIQ